MWQHHLQTVPCYCPVCVCNSKEESINESIHGLFGRRLWVHFHLQLQGTKYAVLSDGSVTRDPMHGITMHATSRGQALEPIANEACI